MFDSATEEVSLKSATCRGCGGPKDIEKVQCVRCYVYAINLATSATIADRLLVGGHAPDAIHDWIAELPMGYLSTIVASGFRISILPEGEVLSRTPKVSFKETFGLDEKFDLGNFSPTMRKIVEAIESANNGSDTDSDNDSTDHNNHGDNCSCKIYAQIKMNERKIIFPFDVSRVDILHALLCVFYRLTCTGMDTTDFGDAVRGGFDAMKTLSHLRLNLVLTDDEKQSAIGEKSDELILQHVISGRSIVGEWDDFAAESTLAHWDLLDECNNARLQTIAADASLLILAVYEAENTARARRVAVDSK